MRDSKQDQHQDHAVGQAEKIPVAPEPAKGLVRHRYRCGVGKNEGQSLGNEHDAKRGDKGWNAEEGHETAGEQPGETAGEYAGHGAKPQVSRGGGITAQRLDGEGRDHAGKGDQAADRKIDPGGDDDHSHSDGDDGDYRDLLHYVK